MSTGMAARRVDRPARCQTVLLRTPRPVKPFAGLCLDAPRRSQTPTRHLSPAVPPSLGVAHPATRWPIDLFAGPPRAWYTHAEPLLVARLGSPAKDYRPAGREALSITQQQAEPTRDRCSQGAGERRALPPRLSKDSRPSLPTAQRRTRVQRCAREGPATQCSGQTSHTDSKCGQSAAKEPER